MSRLHTPYYFFATLILACCMLFPLSLKAQSERVIDSLKQQLEKYEEGDSVLLRPLLRLASVLRHSATSEALAYGHKALRMADSLQITEAKASAQQILALIYTTRLDYRNSLFYTFQALRTYEMKGDSEGIAYAYNAIGIVYQSMKHYELSKKYFFKTLSLLERLGLKDRYAMVYNNLGNSFAHGQQQDECLKFYKKAVLYANPLEDHSIASAMLNIGWIYLDKDLLDSAGFYLREALRTSSSVVYDENSIANACIGLGKLYLKKHMVKEAEMFLIRARNIAESGNIAGLQISVYESFIEFYRIKKNVNLMYEYNRKCCRLKDNIYNETTIKQVNEMQLAYQVEKRDYEISMLNQKHEVIKAAAYNQRLVRNSLIVALLLIIVIALVITRNILLKQHMKNRVLSEKNALDEKDIIKLNHENTLAKYEAMKSKTDPHFLFNSLTALSSVVMEDPKQAVRYIKQFSLLFRMVLEYSDQPAIMLDKELEIVHNYIYLQQIRYGEHLTVSLNIADAAKHTLIPPFALQMLIENAIKHNEISQIFPLNISIYTEKDDIVVCNGLHKKLHRSHSSSTGQKSIKERYHILGAGQPLFRETETEYIVKLPIVQNTVVHSTEDMIV